MSPMSTSTVALNPAATLVSSKLTLTRNPQAPRGPLVLLGEELELVSLKIDGCEPAAPRITPTCIEIDIDGDSASA
jgi:aminopeptidase N